MGDRWDSFFETHCLFFLSFFFCMCVSLSPSRWGSPQEKAALSARLDEMTEQSLSLFQKRDDLDELEGFQQQELAKVKHMVWDCSSG